MGRSPVRATISTVSTVGDCTRAASRLAFSGVALPPRTPSSAVITRRVPQSFSRLARASGEKPANTTEWIAPMRAQASMA